MNAIFCLIKVSRKMLEAGIRALLFGSSARRLHKSALRSKENRAELKRAGRKSAHADADRAASLQWDSKFAHRFSALKS